MAINCHMCDTYVGVAYVGQSLLTTVARQKINQRKQHISDCHMTANIHRSSAEDFKFPVHRHITTRRPWISNAEETGPAAGRRCVVAATRCRSSAENYDSAARRRDPTAEWSTSAAHRELLASHAASPPTPYGAAPTTAADDVHKTLPPEEQISRWWQQSLRPRPETWLTVSKQDIQLIIPMHTHLVFNTWTSWSTSVSRFWDRQT